MILGGESSVLGTGTGTFAEHYQKLHELGLQGAHVSFTAQEAYGLWCGSLTDAQLQEVRQVLSPFKRINIHAGFGEGLSLLSYHPGMRKITMEEYLANLEIAQKIGASVVDFHVGAESEILKPEQHDALMTEALLTIDNKAQELGVHACWETGEKYFIPLEKYDRIRELGLNNTGICLDTGHLVRVWRQLDPDSKIKTFSEFIERYGDLIRSMHIHDWQDAPKGKHTWNDHHMVGDGEINWREVFSSLVKIGYDGVMTMEYHPNAVRYEEDYVKNCEYIRKLVRECGGKIQ